MEEKFAIALSEKAEEEASKEVSLKIKSVFPKSIRYLLVFFTPQYHPWNILNSINFTLKPHMIIGTQTPLLIFENKLIEKGVVACCINKAEAELKTIFIKNDEPQNIESSLRSSLKDYPREEQSMFSLLSHQFNIFNYLRGVELSLGKSFDVFGAGYIKKYFSKNYQIIGNSVEEGLLNVMVKGIEIDFLRISGFIPLGKPFTITKAISKKGIIMEINGQPAINIYKHYLREKFDSFMKNYLFSLYPLGIRRENDIHLVSIIEYLQDGSLACVGEIKENSEAHIMLLQPSSLMESLDDTLQPLKDKEEGLVFIINSMTRKKILKEHAEEEISIIKNNLGDKFKLFGIYSDYSFFTNKETREIELESGSLLAMGLR
ncbi:MAG: FIST C-terminal domain-containing protein [Candidatus Omnitrophota bacterium]|nr:FIST C-terminal domain-containing protein [Candidatus Omnitrophota bacterium]